MCLIHRDVCPKPSTHANSGCRSTVQHPPLTSYLFADYPLTFLRRFAETDWEKTSLKPYVALLDAHNKSLMEETRRRKRGDKGADMSTSEFFISSAITPGCCFIVQPLTGDLGW